MRPLDPALRDDFRHVLGHFATGLSVLTAAGPVGLTVQAMMSLSITPPLVALGIDRRSRVWPHVRAGGAFCLNLLSVDQEQVARRFGRSDDGKFAGLDWRPGPHGVPELSVAHAWIDATVHAEHDGGDHLLVVAAVRGLRVGTGDPLVFHRGRAGRFAHP